MEIELKYRIPSAEVADRVWDDSLFSGIEEEASREEIELHAIYYDTEDLDLANHGIAYRVRQEGERLIATLKWKGKTEDGLHVREELTVPVENSTPDLGIFMESDIGDELENLLRDRDLTELLRTDILRRCFRIDTGDGIYELSVDVGTVIAGGGSTEIREVEVELFSGETEELLDIGRKLQDMYGLEPENTSKYAKGLKLVRGEAEAQKQ